MITKMETIKIINYLEKLYPDAKCELDFNTPFQLLIAVVLSAQTTDKMVNKVTPTLFEKFPDAFALANANLSEVEACIKNIGLYKNKSKMIIELSKKLVKENNGEIKNNQKFLMALPGVGQKTANVVRSVIYEHPAIAVDTHVNRVSKRLGLAKFDDSLEIVEAKLKRKIPRDKWIKAHHLFIFFGRYYCKATNPSCETCALKSICRKEKYNAFLKKG